MKSTLKFVSSSFFMIIITMLLLSIPAMGESGEIYKNYGITQEKYDKTADWDQIVHDVFGPDYRVADWDDLVIYNKSGDLGDLFDGLGLTDYEDQVFVTCSGHRSYSSTRYYFATRHNHNPASGYLAHSNIDNYLISLGSWDTTEKILAIKVTDDSGVTYENFGMTQNRYSGTTDWDQIVNNVFGPDYRVADWEDFVLYYESGKDLENLFDELGLTDYGDQAFVTNFGEKSYSSTRYYFATRHNHNPVSGYLVHSNIDNYLISLGSWDVTDEILVVKTTETPMNSIADTNSQSTTNISINNEIKNKYNNNYTSNNITNMEINEYQNETTNNILNMYVTYAQEAKQDILEHMSYIVVIIGFFISLFAKRNKEREK
ncbi:hypothetical protein [uncultured Methanolobus sp.]|uniref:hypothetical protein n=1 Tax=uncultured Methanolobus sp. TaxID=218300 RepID=UPI002AAAB48A|nr:hypothetical protein [uncultured Methanolobus sp.]